MSEPLPAGCLGDYVTLQRGNTYKSALLGKPGPVLLGLASISRNGGFKADNLKTYGGPSDERIILQPGDVYVSLKDVTQSADLLGAVSKVPPFIESGRLTQDTVKLEFKSQDAPKDYIYWLLRTPQYRAYCRAHATGTTNLGLAREDFFSFPIPPLTPERATLVTVIQSIDDKVELNRRMNLTLEAMAQAIFDDWFVAFGPTRTKVARGQPYLPTRVWDHFPSVFEDGKPSGWTIEEIRNKASAIQYGLTESAKEEGPGPQFLRITDIQGGRISWSRVPFCDVNELDEQKYQLATGDIVVARTGASTGENCYVVEPPRAVFASYLVRFRFRDSNFARVVAQFMRSNQYRSFVASNIGGSAQPNASAQLLGSATIVCPSPEVALAFSDIVSPMDKLKRSNELENETLVRLRELLLPKLMSGEIGFSSTSQPIEKSL